MSHHILTPEELFCLEGCRNYEQYHHMRMQFESEVCPFCTIDRSVNKVLWEDSLAQCWAVPTEFLRSELRYHFIITPKQHVRFEHQLSFAEVASMHSAKLKIAMMCNLDGGIVATRFGDMRLNAGTVPHLHTNIMVPNSTGEVRIPVFKDPHDREKNLMRAEVFARQYEAEHVFV